MFSDTLAVTPAHDESKTIVRLVRVILSLGCPVLVVNDGSKDDTACVARSAGALVLDLPEQSGYSHAVLAGLGFALEHGFLNVISIDADGAHDPAEVPTILKQHMVQGNDLTIGNRFGPECDRGVPSTKRWANFFASSLLNICLGTSFDDVASGFRVFEIGLVKQLLAIIPLGGYSLPYQTVMLASRRGLRVSSVPISVHYDASVLLGTRVQEMLDLIVVLEKHERLSNVLGPGLALVRELVVAFEPFTVKVAGETLCLHPLDSTGAYVFQVQDRHFLSRAPGRVIDFDKTSITGPA